MQANNVHLLSDLQQAMRGGTEPPDNGGMTLERLEKLEAFADRTADRLTRVEEKLDFVIHEVRQFKWWVIGQIVALFVAVIGTGVAIQQMTVATFQGAAQVAKDSAPSAAPAAAPPIIINVPQSAPLSSTAPPK